jgi:two-component system chemotaxis response regulator CheB
MAPVRTLIVDDSASMRATLNRMLSADPAIEVVGMAPEPFAAREMIKTLNPDVLTLDVEMPGMDGLSFLERIMRLRPMPVVMCSTLTARGAQVTIEALRLGAVDYVTKPSGTPEDIERDATLLCEKVKTAARSVARAGPTRLPPQPSIAGGGGAGKLIAIGSSTGGVEALIAVLQKFPANCPPTVITQHMPPTFTKSFAERLNRLCAPVVQEATDGARLEIGKIYLAPGGERHLQVANAHAPCCRLIERDPVNGHRPSVDVLFDSVAELAGRNAVGVILTGMGRDGAAGLLKMRHAGARTLGQNEKTSVVYGMPRVAYELGAVEQQLPLNAIGEEILKMTAARKEGTD